MEIQLCNYPNRRLNNWRIRSVKVASNSEGVYKEMAFKKSESENYSRETGRNEDTGGRKLLNLFGELCVECSEI